MARSVLDGSKKDLENVSKDIKITLFSGNGWASLPSR